MDWKGVATHGEVTSGRERGRVAVSGVATCGYVRTCNEFLG
jgi:hypothetical protein